MQAVVFAFTISSLTFVPEAVPQGQTLPPGPPQVEASITCVDTVMDGPGASCKVTTTIERYDKNCDGDDDGTGKEMKVKVKIECPATAPTTTCEETFNICEKDDMGDPNAAPVTKRCGDSPYNYEYVFKPDTGESWNSIITSGDCGNLVVGRKCRQ